LQVASQRTLIEYLLNELMKLILMPFLSKRVLVNFASKFWTILVFIYSICPSDADSQWQNVAPNLLGQRATIDMGGSMSFSNGRIWAGRYELWMSPDTGKTWIKKLAALPNKSQIMNINFFDKENGVIATIYDGVYITHNGGISWKQSPPRNFNVMDAFFTDSKDNIIIIPYSEPINISHDGGLSWKAVVGTQGSKTAGTYNTDGNAYVMAFGSLLRSSDFGDTWHVFSNIPFKDIFSFTFDHCHPNILYLANENAAVVADGFSHLMVSTNFGNSWEIKVSKKNTFSPAYSPFFLGSIVNSDNAIFAQTRTDGIYRSTNFGENWKSIGGANNLFDSRYITAVNDNIIFAVDNDGSVWKTESCGGDPLVFDAMIPIFTTKDLTVDTIGESSIAIPFNMSNLDTKHDLEVTVHYDSILKYKGSFSPDNTQLDIVGEQWSGRSKLHIFKSTNDKEIVSSFFTHMSDSTSDGSIIHVWFDSVQILGAKFTCNLSFVETKITSTITFKQGCGIKTIETFMRTGRVPSLQVYPNPSNNKIIVILSDSSTLALYDMLGRRIKEYPVFFGKVDLDVSAIPAGTYFLSTKNGTTLQYECITIIH
jgi:photosystem II stability/assembly factor-like uncharacterized protein